MLDEGFFRLKEKYNVLVNVEDQDKAVFRSIIDWSGEMMDLTVKERFVRDKSPVRGEVWTCNFGVNIGSETNNTRPCLIIQEDTANEKSATVIAIPFTNHAPRFPSHMEIFGHSYEEYKDEKKIATGTLMTDQLRNVSKARLGKPIGKLSEITMKKVQKCLSNVLAMESV